jgi:hypothetical protein
MLPSYIELTAEQYTNHEDKDGLLSWLRSNFPYKRLLMTEAYVREAIVSLRHYEPTWLRRSFFIANLEEWPSKQLLFRGQPRILVNNDSDYDKYNKAVEYFSDPVRMTAKRLGSPSPLEQWQADPSRFVDSCLATYGRLDAYSLRETVYHTGLECTEFKASNAAAFISFFKPSSILDFSAGRGARLMAAISKGVHYTGVDPDPRAVQCCRDLIQFYGSEETCTMIQAPFQRVDDLGYYDMVLTSPPYFTLEIYSDDDDQSTKEFPTLDGWLRGFLYPSLKKAWSVLKSGGHMVLNINDFHRTTNPRYKFTKLAVDYVSSLSGAVYLGVIGSAHAKSGKLTSVQPFWIWRKR